MIGAQIKRLAGQSLIYGLGGIVSRLIAVFLLPLYTSYLAEDELGKVGVLLALNAVLVTILRGGVQSAFFRFYFDSAEPEARRTVVRTSFWFTMTSATTGLVAGWLIAAPISDALAMPGEVWLVRAQFVGLWAQMNYEQMTALFRVEQRPVGFVAASLANIAVTISVTVILVVGLDKGALGVIVGNFTGTLVVYIVLLAYRRGLLGLEFDRKLFETMERFGLPLVPSALALIAVNFSDRFFIAHLTNLDEVGRYELGVRIAAAMVLLLTAFRNAWPAFAYSIEDESLARRTYAFVLTYLVTAASWVALTLGLLSPWLVRILAPTNHAYWPGGRVVGVLAFGAVLLGGYIVVSIGIGRARRTQFNWIVTGAAAVLNVTLNLILIPRHGIMGAAVATLAAYALMFVLMSVHAQRAYPTPYQWRRVATALGAGAALLAAGKAFDVSLPVALALCAAYPLTLLLLGFYSPAERERIQSALRLRQAAP